MGLLIFATVSLADWAEAMRWIINHQLGRRNLDALQRDMLIGQRYEWEKKAHGAQPGNQNAEKHPSENPTGVSEPSDDGTAERLATEYQVSRDPVITHGQFVQGLDAMGEIREDLPTSILTTPLAARRSDRRGARSLPPGVGVIVRLQAFSKHWRNFGR
jgi:hypothetical protein